MLSAFIDWRRRLPSSRAVQLAANYWKLYDVNVTQHYMESKEQDIPQGSKMLSAPLSSLAHLRSSRREIYSYMFTKRRDFAVLEDSTCVQAAVTAMLRVQNFFTEHSVMICLLSSPSPPEDLGLQQGLLETTHQRLEVKNLFQTA